MQQAYRAKHPKLGSWRQSTNEQTASDIHDMVASAHTRSRTLLAEGAFTSSRQARQQASLSTKPLLQQTCLKASLFAALLAQQTCAPAVLPHLLLRRNLPPQCHLPHLLLPCLAHPLLLPLTTQCRLLLSNFATWVLPASRPPSPSAARTAWPTLAGRPPGMPPCCAAARPPPLAHARGRGGGIACVHTDAHSKSGREGGARHGRTVCRARARPVRRGRVCMGGACVYMCV